MARTVRRESPVSRRSGYWQRMRRRPWWLLAALLVTLAMLLAWPMIRVVMLSFQKYGLKEMNTGQADWIGLANFAEIFQAGYLWQTVLPNTIGFALVCVVITVLLGTLVGLFLTGLPTWARYIATSAIMVAWAVPAVTGTYVWVFLFEPSNGLVTNLLGSLGMIEPGTVNWFTDRLGFFTIAALNVIHHGFPFVAVTVMSGLMTIPVELYESAEVDGATRWQQFWRITVPLLKPIFAVVTILSTIWDFKVFTQIYLMPGGGGTNKDVFNLGVWSYTVSFGQGKYGLGSAIAVLLTLLLLLITLVYMWTLFREDEL